MTFKKPDRIVVTVRREHRTKDVSGLFCLRCVSLKPVVCLCVTEENPRKEEERR